ncbi:hypothetical protein [Mycobacterium avium]|uniref:hypothetical protein n=1 Tax=Mycobacterium avium TaxID=1764 RepID=UPI0003D1F113|nr:hypothetical protein [Mycobacterium avium]ETB31479.1 hypothetical protein O971_05875 [Mycobacterium avium subsp. hominissuis 10-4249]KDO94867.1 hypothetical protein MAVA5_15350 [Mycobacterium avium subsp. hominissuis A5]
MPLVETVAAGLLGAAGAQVFTWIREHRKNRDAYRAPQREAIGAIIAAGNSLKVGLSDMLEHSGLTGRPTTSNDAAARSLNEFLTALLVMDEKFSIGRLTIVDGPCRDMMLTAYMRYSQLRNFANTGLLGTRTSFEEFLGRLDATVRVLDGVIAELVDLAERRLAPSRPLLSKKSALNVASDKRQPAGQDGDTPTSD